jgi:hypothetical protein
MGHPLALTIIVLLGIALVIIVIKAVTAQGGPRPGDVIFADRGLYKHYGVYIGHNKVIHFSGPKGYETKASMADIIQTSTEDFLKGDLLEIQDDGDKVPLPRKEIVRRAKSRLHKCKGDYSLIFNNCEHFANWCRYNEHISKQVENGAQTAKDLLFTIGGGIWAGLKLAQKDKTFRK